MFLPTRDTVPIVPFCAEKDDIARIKGGGVDMKSRPPLLYTLQAVLSWILEEVLLAAFVLWILPHFFNINVPLWGLAILMLALAILSGVMYRVGRRTFFIRPKVAAENIIGSEGTVTKPLTPEGYVKVQGVLWKARCKGAEMEVGDEVEVIGMEGLKLVVKPKKTVPNKKP
jgi:membrane protein implicated in regulation of membrane protease activity